MGTVIALVALLRPDGAKNAQRGSHSAENLRVSKPKCEPVIGAIRVIGTGVEAITEGEYTNHLYLLGVKRLVQWSGLV